LTEALTEMSTWNISVGAGAGAGGGGKRRPVIRGDNLTIFLWLFS
jgi:hypothetical protein